MKEKVEAKTGSIVSNRAEKRRQEKVMEELDKATPDISGTDTSAPPEISTAIAARQRQILRNNAVLLNLSIALARKRHAIDEVKTHGKQLDTMVRDIAELDTLYPGAKKQMDELDAKAIAENRL